MSSPASNSPSASASADPTVVLPLRRHVYLVVSTAYPRYQYSAENASVVAAYSTPQAANAAAVQHFISSTTEHTDVSCEICSGQIRITANGGGDDDDMTVDVQELTVIEEEASGESIDELRQRVKQAVKRTRERLCDERKMREEEEGGYDSCGKPMRPRRAAEQTAEQVQDNAGNGTTKQRQSARKVKRKRK